MNPTRFDLFGCTALVLQQLRSGDISDPQGRCHYKLSELLPGRYNGTTITTAITKLVERGLVERLRDTQRFVTMIGLSSDGRIYCETHVAILAAQWAKAERRFADPVVPVVTPTVPVVTPGLSMVRYVVVVTEDVFASQDAALDAAPAGAWIAQVIGRKVLRSTLEPA